MEREMEHQITEDNTTKKSVHNSVSLFVNLIFRFGLGLLLFYLIGMLSNIPQNGNGPEAASSTIPMLGTQYEDNYPHETLFKIWYLKEKGFNIDSFLICTFHVPEPYVPSLKILSNEKLGLYNINYNAHSEFAEISEERIVMETFCLDILAEYKNFEAALEGDPAFLTQAKDNLKNHVENSAVLSDCSTDFTPELMFDSCATLQKGLNELSEFLGTIENLQTAQLLAGGCYNSQVRGAGTLLTFEDNNVVAHKVRNVKKQSVFHFFSKFIPDLSKRYWIELIQISGVGSVLFTVYNVDKITPYWDGAKNRVFKIKLKKPIVIDESGLKTNEFNIRGSKAESLYRKWRMFKGCLKRGIPFARTE